MMDIFVNLNFSDFSAWLLVFFIIFGIMSLIVGGQILTKGAVYIANFFHISPLVIGLTVVSIATSMPELFTCFTAIQKSPDLALGSIVGSNIANIGLILGVTALFSPLVSQTRLVQKELPFLLVLTGLFVLFALGGYSRLEGCLLLASCFAYLIWIIKSSIQESQLNRTKAEVFEINSPKGNLFLACFYILLGAFLLSLGADSLVMGAQELSFRMGVSEVFVGVSVIALGTSLPELAASLSAVFAKKNELCIGNVVGSNLFNLSLIGGATATFSPFPVASEFFKLEFPALIVMTLILFFFLFKKDAVIARNKAIILLSVYFGMILLIALN